MKDLLKRLWDLQPDTTRLLEAMVNMDSPSSDKALVDLFGRFIGSEFEALGGDVEHIAAGRFGDHVLVRFPGSDRVRPVLLLGHTDTVFSSGEAVRRPFKIQEGKATGPGVFDMKAGIAVMWAALKTMRSVGPLPRPVTVLLNSDEEVGSPTSRPLIENEAQAVKAALVLEPSLPGGAVKTSRKGTGQFTIKAIGRAAHTGIDPERGINAIAEIALQVQELHKLSAPGAGTTVTVSVIQGGTRVNVVPAEAGLEADIRVSSHEEAARITEAIRGLKAQLPGASLQIRGGINRPPMERSSDIAGLFALAKEIASEMDFTLEEGSTGGASDGNFTSAMGVPTLDGLGPIGRGAHSLEEYVEIDSIPQRAALLAELIRRV
jgi:glutamate carboxypeptidase